MLNGIAGVALFAQQHETLIPILYDPTDVVQITLTELFGSQALAVSMLVVVFGLCTWSNGNVKEQLRILKCNTVSILKMTTAP